MAAVRVLGRGDLELAAAIVDTDPVAHVFVASRLDAGVLEPHLAGDLWAYPAERPRALLHVGANLVPVNTDAQARQAFAERLGPVRPFCAIVGPREEALGLWRALSDAWGPAYARVRAVRERQPVLAADGECPIAEDPRVRRATPADLPSYFDAAVAMYTEELDEDPLESNPHGYRRHVRGLIDAGRAYAIVQDGEVVFKADVGALGHGVAQVQGVWLHPRLRGRGLAGPAMAAVTNRIVRAGRVAALYVNDFNAPARALYARCGYIERGVFSTVLY